MTWREKAGFRAGPGVGTFLSGREDFGGLRRRPGSARASEKIVVRWLFGNFDAADGGLAVGPIQLEVARRPPPVAAENHPNGLAQFQEEGGDGEDLRGVVSNPS